MSLLFNLYCNCHSIIQNQDFLFDFYTQEKEKKERKENPTAIITLYYTLLFLFLKIINGDMN